jgi:lysophospholipase L1-like esterase
LRQTALMEDAPTLVCTGDSFTEGLSDIPRSDGRVTGWADRVAEALGARYANLAVRGKLLDQVVDEQVPAALALNPTILTFHAGPNDVLRPRRDPALIAEAYAAAVAGIRAQYDGTLVLFTSRGRLGTGGRTETSIRERFVRFNIGVREVAAANNAVLVDLESSLTLGDPRLWDDDRLHFNTYGHVRVAVAVLEALGVEDEAVLGGPIGWWREPLPVLTPRLSAQDAIAGAAWARRHLAPWVVRRMRGVSSGDGVTAKDSALRDARHDVSMNLP